MMMESFNQKRDQLFDQMNQRLDVLSQKQIDLFEHLMSINHTFMKSQERMRMCLLQ